MKFFESPAPNIQINTYLSTHNVLAPLSGIGKGIFVHLKEVNYRDHRPHLTLDGSFGEMTRPLCVSRGMDINRIQQLQDSSVKISLKKTSLGESVFFLTPRVDKSIFQSANKALDTLRSCQAEFWLHKGLQLKPSEHTKKNGEIYNSQQCYLKALSLSKDMAVAWNCLGNTLNYSGPLKMNSITIDKAYCYSQALQFEQKAMYWYNLGLTLSHSSSNTIKNPFSTVECYIRALTLDNGHTNTWLALGDTLSPELGKLKKPVFFDNQWMGAKDCYVKAVEASGPEHQRSAIAWLSLGIALDKNETASVANKVYRKHECFLQGLRLDQNNADLWAKTGFHTPEKIGSIVVNGATYSKIECQLKALKIDRYDPITWNYLGELLKKDSIDIDGEHYNAQECLVQALTLVGNRYPKIWSNLGDSLGPRESVKVNGEILNRSQCYAQSLKINPHNPFNNMPVLY